MEAVGVAGEIEIAEIERGSSDSNLSSVGVSASSRILANYNKVPFQAPFGIVIPFGSRVSP